MADFSEVKVNFTLKELSFSGQNEDSVPGSSRSVELHDKKRLVCVEYPAVVSSVDKMLETLGGEQTISKVRKTDSCCCNNSPHPYFCKPLKDAQCFIRIKLLPPQSFLTNSCPNLVDSSKKIKKVFLF